MRKYGLYIVIILLCFLQILSFIKIVELKKDLDNTGTYLSRKIDNVTSKVNMLRLSSDQKTTQMQPFVNPNLQANVSNDVRVELPDDLKQGQLGTLNELKLFSDFVTHFKFEDVKTIIANAYPTILNEDRELSPEESLKLITLVKDIKPTVISKIDNSNLKGGWGIYIQTSDYGVQLGGTGNLIICAFDGIQGWYIFGDRNVQLYDQIYGLIKNKQKD